MAAEVSALREDERLYGLRNLFGKRVKRWGADNPEMELPGGILKIPYYFQYIIL
jgi:hypothetical protein